MTQALDLLKTAVGDAGWLSGEDMATYSRDWRHVYQADPLLVLRPKNTQEVGEVVRICSRHGITIVSQGGNTGLAGGAVAYHNRPSVIVATTRLNSILDVDPEGFTISAEAGVTIERLQDAARQVNRELAIDFGARGSATVGGAVSTDAGGINVLRSGTMRDQVLGLEVVLPDGRVWDGLRALRKDASGYGLKHLFIGAEGTLGVVTKVVLKLEPRRVYNQSFLAAVADFDRLSELYALAQETAQQSLSAFELLPDLGVNRVCEKFPSLYRPMATVADWYVLGRISSNEPADELLDGLLATASGRNLIHNAVVAQSASQEENLWMLRDELPPEFLFSIKGAKFDAAVPVNHVASYYNRVAEFAATLNPAPVVYAFGHVGDGNLHLYLFNWSAETGQPQAMTEEQRLMIERRVDQITWDFGGTISAEHGVGQELTLRMAEQKPEVELDLLARIKRAIDPDGLFNPGRGAQGSWE